MRRLFTRGAMMLGALCLVAATAQAANPLKPAKFAFNPSTGYILLRAGPTGSDGKAPPIYLARVDESWKKTIWSFGGRHINSKKEMDAAMVWGGDHFGTDGKTSLYLVPVNPGNWVIGGAGATAMSLGSYGFEVKPGEITYVGTVLTGQENGKSDIPEVRAAKLSKDLLEFGTLMNIVMSDALLVRAADESEALPPAIKAHPVTRAKLIPDVRFNNFLAALVNRAIGLPPLGHQNPNETWPWQEPEAVKRK